MITTFDFVKESNAIEGIFRDPKPSEIITHDWFVRLQRVTTPELQAFLAVYEPSARLRYREGDNVQVGGQMMPPGGPNIVKALDRLLERHAPLTPFELHAEYENLHPFTDGNGRSGRALWAWKMARVYGELRYSFLQHWYCQSLQNYQPMHIHVS